MSGSGRGGGAQLEIAIVEFTICSWVEWITGVETRRKVRGSGELYTVKNVQVKWRVHVNSV